MSDKLQEICTVKREFIAKLKKQRSLSLLEKEARHNDSPLRDFKGALLAKTAANSVGIIAEIKKASPSAGVIRENFNPMQLARAYEAGGAACLSVLTEENYFQGNNADLIMARSACSLPILRKDFIVDPWQVAEARAIGADCILIIMAVLDDGLAAELHSAAVGYGMEVLLESHDRAELERALKLPTGLIGINNRNLKTLKTDIHTTEELAPLVPKDRMIVSESGLVAKDDLKRMKNCGVNCFLIGESLLKQPDVETAVRQLLGP